MQLDAQTRQQLSDVYETIRSLMGTPSQKRRPIGFTADLGHRK